MATPRKPAGQQGKRGPRPPNPWRGDNDERARKAAAELDGAQAAIAADESVRMAGGRTPPTKLQQTALEAANVAYVASMAEIGFTYPTRDAASKARRRAVKRLGADNVEIVRRMVRTAPTATNDLRETMWQFHVIDRDEYLRSPWRSAFPDLSDDAFVEHLYRQEVASWLRSWATTNGQALVGRRREEAARIVIDCAPPTTSPLRAWYIDVVGKFLGKDLFAQARKARS